MGKTWDQHEGEKHAQNGCPGMGGPTRSGAAGLGEGPFLDRGWWPQRGCSAGKRPTGDTEGGVGGEPARTRWMPSPELVSGPGAGQLLGWTGLAEWTGGLGQVTADAAPTPTQLPKQLSPQAWPLLSSPSQPWMSAASSETWRRGACAGSLPARGPSTHGKGCREDGQTRANEASDKEVQEILAWC